MSSRLSFDSAVFVLAFLLLQAATLVQAGLYVVLPSAGSTCHGGEPCTIEWLDDGTRPLLAAIGVSTVGLYTGEQQLVQTIQPVNVGSRHSIIFTPNPAAGPNSNAYYIAIVSTTLEVNATSYSPWFSLDRMTGSFNSPLPSATRPIPIPSSLLNQPSSTVLSTITVGTLSQSPSPSPSVSSISASSSSSRFVTSISSSVPSSTSTSTSAAAASTSPSTANTSGALGKTNSRSKLATFACLSTVLVFLS